MAQLAIYADTDELKARLDIATVDAARDAVLLDCLLAASRQVDGLTDRYFGVVTAEARTFTPAHGDWLPIDDLIAATAVAADEDGDRVYEATWATTDYDLEPENAAARGMPYTALRTAPNGVRAFVPLRRGVRVTGTWGWPAVPDPVREATLVTAIRLFKRRDAPLGVLAGADGGAVRLPAVDPEVVRMLAPYRRLSLAGV